MATSSMRKVGVVPLLIAATTTGAGEQKDPWSTNRTFEAYGTTASGSGSATVVIEVRDAENADWKTMATITIAFNTTVGGDGFASAAAWKFVRANISAISGTGAAVSVNMGTAPL